MNWNAISLYVGIDGEINTPLSGVNVNFILLNNDTLIQYQSTVETDSNGNAVLTNDEDSLYIKTNYGTLSYNGEIEETIVDNDDCNFDDVVKWYAYYESDNGIFETELYDLSGITNSSIVIQNQRASQQELTTINTLLLTTFFYGGGSGHSPFATPSEYCIYFYNDNNINVGAITGVTSSTSPSIGQSEIDITNYPSATKFKICAYSDYNNIKKWYYNDASIFFSNLTIVDNKYSFGAELQTQYEASFAITSFSALDMIQKLFNLNYGVSPFRLKVMSYYDEILYNAQFSNSAIQSTIGITMTGDSTNPVIPKIKLVAEPLSTNSSLYYSGITEVDLYKCQYYNVLTFNVAANVQLPNKSLEVENPIILDTITTNLSTPAYNLPNVDFNFSFIKASNSTILATTTGSSSYSSTTFNVPQNIDISAADYLRTIVGQNSTYKLNLYLSKHHYNNKTISNMFISALTYVDGVETIPAKLYFCKKYNNNPIAGPYFQNIDREQYVCFRRIDFSEYVQGFDFVYAGNVIQSGSIFSSISISLRGEERETYPGVSGFNLDSPTKIIAANRDFYSACSYNTYPKLNEFLTMSEYINGFVNAAASRPEIITKYTENNLYNNDYNLNGHAYSNGETQKLTFEPVATDDYNYLEFSTVDDENASVTLRKTGTSNPITTLQYSYWGFRWRPYTIGTEIIIVPGSNVRFRNSENTTSFSNSSSDYYYFDIEGDSVKVKGNISSLINVSANGLTVTGSYAFYGLFKESLIYNARDLVLDPTSISYGCYLQMFQCCTNLYHGPERIEALTGNTACLQKTFSGCTTMKDCFNSIKLKNVSDYCCDKIFEGCSDLKNAPIFENYSYITNLGVGSFGQAFRECFSLTGSTDDGNWQIGSTNCTYGTNSCYEMFAGCYNLKSTPIMTPLVVGSMACYGTFSGCTSLTNHRFNLTASNGTVSTGGCSYMFTHCTNLQNSSQFKLNFTDLSDKCYFHMFECCSSLSQLPTIQSTIVPNSGCAYMYADCFQRSNSKKFSQFITTGLTSIGAFGMAYMFKNCKYLDFNPVYRILTCNNEEAEFTTNTLYDLTDNPNPSNTNDWGPYQSDINNSVAIGYDYDNDGLKRYHVKFFTYNVTNSSTGHGSGYGGYFYEYGPYFKNHNNELTHGYDLQYEYIWRYINATKLSDSCCEYMFSGCTSLHYGNHIILNANALAVNCYGHMFQGCVELVSTPTFFSGVTSYAESACQYMFAFCSSSKGNNEKMKPQKNSNGNIIRDSYMNWIDPDVSSSYTKSYYIHQRGLRSFQKLYNYKFNQFGDYVQINTADSKYSFVDFSANSENLKSISNNIVYVGSSALLQFTNVEAKNACFSHMFYGCSGLVTAYANIKTSKANENAYEYMFAGCHSLSGGLTFGSSLVSNDTAKTNSFRFMFDDCFELRNNCAGNSNTLLPLTVEENAYCGMYRNCYKIRTGPQIDAINVGSHGCSQMFRNCFRLENIKNNILPGTQLSTACYSHMFNGCASLQTAPELPCTNIPVSGYNYMFNGCNLWYFTGETNYRFWATLVANVTGHGNFHYIQGISSFEIYGSYFSYSARTKSIITPTINDTFKLDYCGNRFYSVIDRSDNGENDAWFKLAFVGGGVPNAISPYSDLSNIYYLYDNNIPYSLNDINSYIYNNIENAVGSGTSHMVSKNYWSYYYHYVGNERMYLYVYNKAFTLPPNPDYPNGQSLHFVDGKNDINSAGNETVGYVELRNKTVERDFNLYDSSGHLLMSNIPVTLPILIDETQLETLGRNVSTYMQNYFYSHGGSGSHYFPTVYNIENFYSEYRTRGRYLVTSGGNKSYSTGYSLNYHGNDAYVTPGEIRNGVDLNGDLESPDFYIPINDKTKWGLGLSEIRIGARTLSTAVSYSWCNMLNLKSGYLRAPNLISYQSNSIHGLPENWIKTN